MHNYAAKIRLIRIIRCFKIYLLCDSKLTMLIFVTTQQCSNEFGTALAAPKIFHFSLFTFPLNSPLIIVHYALCIKFTLLSPLSSLLFNYALCIVHLYNVLHGFLGYKVTHEIHDLLAPPVPVVGRVVAPVVNPCRHVMLAQQCIHLTGAF